VSLQATIFCGFSNSTMSRLDVPKNGMISMFPTMSLLHKIFFISCTISTKTTKTMKEILTWIRSYILVLQAMSSPGSLFFGPNQLNFPLK